MKQGRMLYGEMGGRERMLLLVKKTNRTQRKILNKDTNW